MLNNTMYIGIDTVLATITSLYKSIDLTKTAVLESCTYAELHELATVRDWFLFKNVPLVIDQKKAALPCNCHKLLDVFSSLNNYTEAQNADSVADGSSPHYQGSNSSTYMGRRVKYRKDGTYLFFADNYTNIYINYRGLPVDDQGRPIFITSHLMALARYCIMNYFEEDFVTGKMDGQRWQYIVDQWEDHRDIARASMRNLSRNDIEQILQINADMIPRLGYIPIYNLD